MKINPIIFALLLIGSQQTLAQMSDGTALEIEKQAINSGLEVAEVYSTESLSGNNQHMTQVGNRLSGQQAPLPATIEKVAQGLASKLDQRMKMDFERGDTVHPTFAFAY
jgi:hypothetical protein